MQAVWERRRQQGDELLQMVSGLVLRNGLRCFTNDVLQQFEEKMKEEMELEEKTRDQIKDEIIKEKNPCFLGILLNALTFGLVPKHVCAVM